jgi:SPP1 gp7 family putative phage head morphogenesis protein
MKTNDSSYWGKRAAQRMFDQMQKAEDAADQVAKLYLKASRYLSSEMEGIFERYKTKYGLSDSEAHSLLNMLQDKTDIEELLRQLKNTESSRSKTELLQLIEAPAYQSRIERLQQLQNQIDLVMRQVYNQEKDFTTAYYVDFANDAYYRSIYEIQQRAGVAFSFAHIDHKEIDKLINSRWSGKNYSERIWGNTRALAQDVKEELLINLVTGRTEQETAQIIANKFAQSAGVARRLIRTESCYQANQMEMKSYEASGITEYEYLATLDLRTSKICAGLDGKKFKVSEQQVGKNCPPMHPWCRSTTVAVLPDELLEGMERIARDPVTGRTYKVPASMNYKEWYEKYVEGKPEAEAAKKKEQNRTADQKQYQKYKDILRENAPKSLEEFQNMKYTDKEKWSKLQGEKEETLKTMDCSDMENLKGKLSDRETRIWYKAHDEKIPEQINREISLENQARQACDLRNKNRTFARDLMKNQSKRKLLDEQEPNKSFEELIQHKMNDKGLSYDEAIVDILNTSTKTRKTVNKSLGLE